MNQFYYGVADVGCCVVDDWVAPEHYRIPMRSVLLHPVSDIRGTLLYVSRSELFLLLSTFLFAVAVAVMFELLFF